ncbi:hypothetical protein ACFVVU_37375 [Kitasatospora sp. NPDC057965]|uniref:hypothetical protein n=1 Tax=Kitasatospora sp. NPDC057965 TaxID=3346291 RepID=UPI0036DF41F6
MQRGEFTVGVDIDTTPDNLAAAAQRRRVREFTTALQALAADPQFADLHAEITDPLAAPAQREQRAALVAARRAVARLQERRLHGGHGLLDERTATQVLLDTAEPEVQYYEFKIGEEAQVGADWLWVWLDPSGGCFMLLVQAKSFKMENRRLAVDLGYRSGKRKVLQMDLLLESAQVFGVPFAYVVYTGTREFRAALECTATHCEGLCRDREGADVLWLAGLSAHNIRTLVQPREWAGDVMHRGLPLEDMLGTGGPLPPFHDLHLRNSSVLPKELRDLIVAPQGAAQMAARMILSQVSPIRMGQFVAADLATMDLPDGAVFPQLPRDRGHLPVPYLPHVLGGLRTEVPEYVTDVLAGRTPPVWVTERLAGIVVVPPPGTAAGQQPLAPRAPALPNRAGGSRRAA